MSARGHVHGRLVVASDFLDVGAGDARPDHVRLQPALHRSAEPNQPWGPAGARRPKSRNHMCPGLDVTEDPRMTQHQSDPASATGAADSYLAGLRERLAADGSVVTGTTWRDRPVLIGSRSDRKARWFGTKADRKSTRLNSSHRNTSRMPSSA